MTYTEALDFIHGIARFGSKPGLRRIKALLDLMGNPQNELKFIHVAGTNGKGSTCTMLSNVFTQAGYKVGLYISPYVLDFRERIQINGQMIDPQDLADSTREVKRYWDEVDKTGDTPSEFETLTAVALDYFKKQKPDIVIFEVGMGGRFDATNVIDTPEVSVITSLSFDHMEFLGDTIEKIAFEKCGIIKKNGITVCYPQQLSGAMEVIKSRCAEEGNPLIVGGEAEILEISFFGTKIKYAGLTVDIPLIGMHQVHNTITALEALKAAKNFPVEEKHILEGIAGTSFPARMEIISKKPLIVLDGAHNQGGAEALGKALDLLKGKKIHAVMGMLGNKDHTGSLGEILPHCASLTAVPIKSNPLSLAPEDLCSVAKPFCADLRTAKTPQEGVDSTLQIMGEDDVILVCGSLYLACEVRPHLLKIAGR